MVDALYTGVAETLRFFVIEKPKAAADAQGVLCFDFADGLDHAVEFACRRAPTADHDAIGVRLHCQRLPGSFQQNLFGLQSIALHAGVCHDGLRAVAAVLGAEAALGVDQHIELHALAMKMPPHTVTSGNQIEQFFLRNSQHGQRILARKLLPVQCLVRQVMPIHGSSLLPIFPKL